MIKIIANLMLIGSIYFRW